MKSLNNFILEKFKINSKNIESNLLNKDDISKIENALFNSGEHTGFRKGCDKFIIEVKDLKDKLKNFYYNIEDIPKNFYKIIKDNANNNILCIFGVGYDGTWSVVIFINTNPYTFIICKNGYKVSKLYKDIETEKEVIDKILDFC